MASLPEPIRGLIAALSRLPGIGPRSAERIALHLVQAEHAMVRNLSETIIRAREQIVLCHLCGALAEQQPCALCADPQRDSALLCLVERPVDVISIERSGAFRARYHVLGGKISPINGIGPEDLRIAQLEKRLEKEPVREVLIALPSDVEGEATSHYLGKLLEGKGVKITRLAHGLPVGSGLEFADELTLSRAIHGRRPLDD
jgi:recombination protein RecR